ncbi:MAG: ABC transporter substrate-binding protein, partial [Pseudomonadota bacterium]
MPAKRSTWISAMVLALSMSANATPEIETKSLDELYAEAMAEGGEFVLRAGGDKPDQIDYYLDKFKARFPELKVEHSVDVSLNHAPRYDNARAAGAEENVPDVIQFQTLHDFEYYAERGFLEPYKPKHWDKVFTDHKDPHGRWTSVYGVTFSNLVNADLVDEPPRDAMDYLDPKLKGKIILTYPHDDDA